jgi:BirA family biotin operon repressor/biotin-[acetyl-CoA-carboxylase] ligase
MEWSVHRFDQIGSTNTWLLEQARSGVDIDHVACLARHQTAGRGRLDRTWEQRPDTAVIMSLGWANVPVERAIVRQWLVSVAACETINEIACDELVGLKWPNDLVAHDRKLAGVLAESVEGESPDARHVVVGIGINVARDAYPTEFAETAISIEELVVDCDFTLPSVTDVVDSLLQRVQQLAELTDEAIADRYRSLLVTTGRQVRVDLIDGASLIGRAIGVDDTGGLVLSTAGGSRIVSVGDVHHVRPSASDDSITGPND